MYDDNLAYDSYEIIEGKKLCRRVRLKAICTL